MPRGPAPAHSLQRDTILNESADAFAEFGYPSATMAALAERCGVSKSLLYHYYPAKDAILFDLMLEYMQRLQALVAAVTAQALPAQEALAEVVRRFVREYETSRTRHMVLLNDVKHLPPAEREIVICLERSVVQSFADLIAVHYRIDPARAKVLTMSVFGMINWTFTWLKPGGPLSYAQFAESVVGLLEGGLSAGADRMKNFAPEPAPAARRALHKPAKLTKLTKEISHD